MVATQPTEGTEAEAQWALVERVLASPQFRRTVRLREFLRYVAARSIDHPGAPLPEQQIGTAVFHRPPDYDTGIDNIVRVSAGDLRRRLEHHFLDEGAGESTVCEMPRGGYTLVFRQRPTAETAAIETASPVSRAAPPVPAPPVPATASHATPAQDPPAQDPSSAIVVDPPPQQRRAVRSDLRTGLRGWLFDVRTLTLAVLCLALAAGCTFLVLQRTRDPWQQSAPLRAIWSQLIQGDEPTDVVLADSSLALTKSITGAGVGLSDYVGYNYRQLANDPRFDASTQAALGQILARSLGNVSDFQAATNVLALSRQHHRFVLGSAHDFTPETLKGANVVLVGGSVSNPWGDLYRDQRSFLMETGNPGTIKAVRNLDVRAGEQTIYLPSPDNVTGYAVVALLPNIDPDKRVLIIEGTDGPATLAASHFITSAAGARALVERIGDRPMPRHVEVLLRSSKLLSTALDATIVAVHTRDN